MTSASNSSDWFQQIYQKVVILVQWIIFSDIYISVGAVAFAYTNMHLLGMQVKHHPYLLMIIAAATMFIYQFSRWVFFKKVTNELSKDKLYDWMQKNQILVKILMIVSVITGAFCALKVSKEVVFILLGLGVISFLYNLKVPVGKTVLTLRNMPFAKIFMIALVWSSMGVILPWVHHHGWQWEARVWELFALQFLYIFIITLPFDINDVRADKETGVKTIPIYIGIRKSKVLLSVLSVIYVILFSIWYVDFNKISIHEIVFLTGIIILIFSLLYKTIIRSNRAEKWQIMLWYDGSLILYYLIYIVSVKV